VRFHLLFNLTKGINKRLKGAKRGGMMSKSLKMWNLNPCWSGSSRGYEGSKNIKLINLVY